MFGLFSDVPIVGKASVEILCPGKVIFDFIGTDLLTNYPRWSPEVHELEKLTEGPVTQGTLCRQVRVDQGHRSESIFKVTIFDPVSRVCFEGISQSFRCDYVLEPMSSTLTRVSLTFELNLELPMRPFEKLIRFAVQDGVKRTVRNIRELIESETGRVGKTSV